MEGFLGIGGNELLIILIFAFLIFGPDKLPGIARTIGRGIAKFRDAQSEVSEVIRKEVYDPNDKENPFQKATEKAAELNKPQQPQSTETFAERKARYDKIRAERKAREDAARAEAAAKVQADTASAPATAAAATTAATAASAADATYDDLDALLGVSKPQPKTEAAASAPAPEGGEA